MILRDFDGRVVSYSRSTSSPMYCTIVDQDFCIALPYSSLAPRVIQGNHHRVLYGRNTTPSLVTLFTESKPTVCTFAPRGQDAWPLSILPQIRRTVARTLKRPIVFVGGITRRAPTSSLLYVCTRMTGLKRSGLRSKRKRDSGRRRPSHAAKQCVTRLSYTR